MTRAASARFDALDVLRGLTIAGMIVVNNPGNWNSVFPQLMHASWNGATFADLIFPTFIFIMGVAMSFALAGRRDAGSPPRRYRRIATRAALLVLLGVILNAASAWPALASIRIPGVLQRIGVTYLVAALITVNATDGQLATAAAGLLGAHWVLLALPFGGAPGGFVDPASNIAAALDRWLFGSHLLTPTGDPEGALGLISSIATALLGALVGRWLLRRLAARHESVGSDVGSLERLAVAGIVAIVLGALWSTVLPLNKSLWTASFAVLACGVATLSLVIVVVGEGTPLRSALAPFSWLGTNPLAIYFLSELLTNVLQRPWLPTHGHTIAPKEWLYWNLLVPRVGDSGGPWSSLLYAALYTLCWIVVAGVMRWRGIRVRV